MTPSDPTSFWSQPSRAQRLARRTLLFAVAAISIATLTFLIIAAKL